MFPYNNPFFRDHADHSCNRYIMSFKCDKPFIYRDTFRNQDVEFMTVYIRGQSFMMHQIRKMIGLFQWVLFFGISMYFRNRYHRSSRVPLSNRHTEVVWKSAGRSEILLHFESWTSLFFGKNTRLPFLIAILGHSDFLIKFTRNVFPFDKKSLSNRQSFRLFLWDIRQTKLKMGWPFQLAKLFNKKSSQKHDFVANLEGG